LIVVVLNTAFPTKCEETAMAEANGFKGPISGVGLGCVKTQRKLRRKHSFKYPFRECEGHTELPRIGI
jgi:hypothetical protein